MDFMAIDWFMGCSVIRWVVFLCLAGRGWWGNKGSYLKGLRVLIGCCCVSQDRFFLNSRKG